MTNYLSKGLTCVVYLNNFGFIGSNFKDSKINVTETKVLLKTLGFIIINDFQ